MRDAVRVRLEKKVFVQLASLVGEMTQLGHMIGLGDLAQWVKDVEGQLNDEPGDLIQRAKDQLPDCSHSGDGDDIEVDDDAALSRADDGVWVGAWIWVANDEDDEDDEDESAPGASEKGEGVKWRYRYTDGVEPLARCPECHHDLTAERGVMIEFVFDSGHNSGMTPSRLDPDGRLIDVDRTIEMGLHSGTLCYECEGLLIDMDGVYEENLEGGA